MIIEVDQGSGFCFGVVKAIEKAEEILRTGEVLYCIGDIVHNDIEVNRLSKLGLITVDHAQYRTLSNCTVLLRAHGEPPETYQYAQKNNIKIIDATCPVVLKLQKRVESSFNELKAVNGQILIYGKKGHAEVVGLVGQTDKKAIVVESLTDLQHVDFRRPIHLYSQTTKGIDGFYEIVDYIEQHRGDTPVNYNDTICRQVANRIPKIKEFVKRFDLILFVSGKKSSNGKMLYNICCKENPNAYFISCVDEIDPNWLTGINSIGICGATSTPKNILSEVKEFLTERYDRPL